MLENIGAPVARMTFLVLVLVLGVDDREFARSLSERTDRSLALEWNGKKVFSWPLASNIQLAGRSASKIKFPLWWQLVDSFAA